jgi:hypothetical protein
MRGEEQRSAAARLASLLVAGDQGRGYPAANRLMERERGWKQEPATGCKADPMGMPWNCDKAFTIVTTPPRLPLWRFCQAPIPSRADAPPLFPPWIPAIPVPRL